MEAASETEVLKAMANNVSDACKNHMITTAIISMKNFIVFFSSLSGKNGTYAKIQVHLFKFRFSTATRFDIDAVRLTPSLCWLSNLFSQRLLKFESKHSALHWI